MPQVILSHPTGNAFVRETLRALQEAHALDTFCTSLGFYEGEPLLRMPMPATWKRNLERRSYALSKHQLKRKPWTEIMRLLGQRVLGARFQSGPIDRIYSTVDKLAAKTIHAKHPDAIYAYEDGAVHSFRTAKTLGIQCLYELPIAYWKELHKLLDETARRRPEWSHTLRFKKDSEQKCLEKDEELELADAVICPSKFVYDTLPKKIRHEKQCVVIPYGAPPPQTDIKKRGTNKRLRVLFAGALSQRKGLADLFDAINLLNRPDIELVVMGSLQAPLSFYKKACHRFTYEAPRPHASVLELMKGCDVFVLPSIIEGRALVQLEALSCGLPLIITPNTGGDDLIEEGETGFLVPYSQPEAIAKKLNWLADNTNTLPDMQSAALRRAQEVSWEHFRSEWIAFLTNILKTS